MARDSHDYLQTYDSRIAKKKTAFVLTLLLTLLAAIFALSLGSINLSWGEVLRTLLGSGEAASNTVIWDIRLPRIVAAILVGAILATSGAVMQCVLNNPLGLRIYPRRFPRRSFWSSSRHHRLRRRGYQLRVCQCSG